MKSACFRVLVSSIALLLLTTHVFAVDYGDLTFSFSGSQGFTSPDSWDLTAGDVTVSFTMDLTDVADIIPASYYWPYVRLGLGENGAVSDFFVLQADKQGWMEAYIPNITPDDTTFAFHDVIYLRNTEWNGNGPLGEYDCPSSDTVSPFPYFDTWTTPSYPGYSWSRGYQVFLDRDQAQDRTGPRIKPGINVETGGVYTMEMTFHAVSPTKGTIFMTINGEPQGIYNGDPEYNVLPEDGDDVWPVGMSFTGDMTKMVLFAGVYYNSGTDMGPVHINALTVTQEQAPPPPPQNDYTLHGFGNTWLYEQGQQGFGPQFDHIQDGIINYKDFAVFASGWGYNYWVSVTDGNDLNPGTFDQPFATIQRARDVVRARIASGMTSDITVYIRSGRYFLDAPIQFTYNDRGRNGFDVIYKGFAGEMPEIIAGQPITGWQLDSGNIYKVNIGTDWDLQALFENGQWARKARSPNTGYFAADSATTGYTTLQYRTGDLSTFDISDATVHLWPGSHMWQGNWNQNYNWVANINPIASVSWATRTFTLGFDSTYPMTVNNRFYVQGAKEFLDAPGEWYHDRSTGWLYYYPYNSPIDNQQIVGAKSKRVLELIGGATKLTDLRFENLKFTMSNSYAQYKPWWGDDWEGMAYLTGVEDITFDRCIFSHSGTSAIYLGDHAQNCAVTNCLIEDLGLNAVVAKGIWAGGGGYSHPDQAYINKFNTFHNNHIRNTGRVVGCGTAMWMYQSGDNIITRNRIENIPRVGIHFYSSGWQQLSDPAIYGDPPTIYGIPVTWENRLIFCHTRNNTIAFNEMINCMYDSQDGGAIYNWGSGANNTIENNFVHDMTGLPDGALMGIYLDDACNFSIVRKNVVTRLSGATDVYPYICKGQENTFENNIAVNNSTRNHVMIMQTGIAPDPADQEPTIDNIFIRNIFHQVGGEYVYQVTQQPWSDSLINEMVAYSDDNVFYHTSGLYKCYKDWRTPMSWSQWTSFGYESNTSTGQDPLFADIPGDDYTVAPGSPAISRGWQQIDLSDVGLTDDFPFAP